MLQRIATTRLPDGSEIAYALAGDGPFLVYAPGWLTHLELSWALPAERGLYESLARGRTLVRYDRPGCGLSGAVDQPHSMALELEVLAAVTRAVGAQRFDLLGGSLGAAVAVSWAAAHPQSVARLVLYGGWVRGPEIADPVVQEHVLGLIAKHWGLGSDVLADIFAPDADTAVRQALTLFQREAASPEMARSLLELCYQVDVSAALSRVQAPTLVIHRDRDRAAPVAQGRLLAASIPGAAFELLPGRSHIPYIGDVDSVARAVRRFLGLRALRRPAVPTMTARQLEVAALVTQGLTNREIGVELSITERSVESHVERIGTRMGFRSRAQIAAWYVGSGARS